MEVASSNQTIESQPPIHRRRSAMSAMVGVFGFFCVVGVAVSVEGSANTFFNLPSLCIAIGGPTCILLVIYGWAAMIDAFAWLARRPTLGTIPRSPSAGSISNKPAEDAVVFFQLAAAFAMACGMLATLAGLILMLTHLEDPHRLGSGVAAALLSQLYGVFLAVLCIAAAAHIARRHPVAATSALGRRAASSAGLITIAGTLTTLVVFGLLMLSLAPGM